MVTAVIATTTLVAGFALGRFARRRYDVSLRKRDTWPREWWFFLAGLGIGVWVTLPEGC